jgi:hypothetical protein
MQRWTVRRWLIGAQSGGSACGTDSRQHALETVPEGNPDCSAMVHILVEIMRGRDHA